MKRKATIIFSVLVFAGVIAAFGAWHYWTHRFDGLIVTVARTYELDPALVKAIIYEESFFDPRARSSQNAVGLMQVTPVTVREWMTATRSPTLREAIAKISGAPVQEQEPAFEEALADPVVSLHVGCWYMNSLLARYRGETHNIEAALAAYNAGPANLERWVPAQERSLLSREEFIARIRFPATRSYVQKTIQNYDYYKKDSDLRR